MFVLLCPYWPVILFTNAPFIHSIIWSFIFCLILAFNLKMPAYTFPLYLTLFDSLLFEERIQLENASLAEPKNHL